MIDKLELVLDKEKEIDLSSKFIQLELEWFQDIISFRLENKDKPIRLLKAPHYHNSDIELGKYGDLVSELKLNDYERLLLILAVVPHIVPSLLSPLLNRLKGIRPVQFQEGGTFSKEGRAFIPTIETFLFLAAGQELEKRLDLLRIFNNKHALIDNHILSFGGTNTEVEEEAFFPNKIISITEEFYSNFILNQEYAPVFGRNFPAQRISTKMEWEDLVLRSSTKMQVEELRNWLKYKDILQEKYNIEKRAKVGFKALFYGPPGTGKTMTAAILGKELGKDVYRVDLSLIVSKYIGETEKNLAKIFDKAERSEWILFFDEADALFGKRTTTESSNDRYANQEVSYLLQRVEEYKGMVILASNFKANIDRAFIRRFNTIVYFPVPKKDERAKLWKLCLPEGIKLSDDVDINQIAGQYELTGAHVSNIVNHALIKMLAENKEELDKSAIHESVIQELTKEGKTI